MSILPEVALNRPIDAGAAIDRHEPLIAPGARLLASCQAFGDFAGARSPPCKNEMLSRYSAKRTLRGATDAFHDRS